MAFSGKVTEQHEPNQNNNNLEAFRAAASLKIAAKRNRINKESTTFNPIKTHLPTTFVQGLTKPQDQFHPILEIEPEENTPFYQNSLSVLGDALDDILHVPPKPTAISLTTLSGACQALVQAGPKWRIPSDPAIESLLLSSNSIDFFKTIDLFDPHTASSWLIKTHSIWNGWYNQLKLIRCLLIHLDRFILARSDTLIPIWELGLDLFRKNVIGRPWNPISLTLSIVISQQITIERTSGTISYGLIRSITDLSYTAFGSKGFTSLISVSLIQTTESFYNKRIRLESETELFNKIFTTPARALNAQLLNTIIRSIETNLIQAHLDVLLSKGLVRLLEGFPDRSSADSLSTFYSLLSRLGDPSPLQQLRTCFSKWIKQVGLSMVTETTTNEDQESGNRIGSGMIESLIEFKTKKYGHEIKKECGPGFTAKLEMMFRDLETSNDLNIAYEKARLKPSSRRTQQQGEEKGSSKEEVVDLTVTILTSGRTLTWTHSLGQVVLTASFPIPTPNNPVEIGTKLVKKVVKKEFTVSTIQALVLLYLMICILIFNLLTLHLSSKELE
ncbi:hypothetical protein KEM48_001191 [Puccinia striiformis f. sp. tritici PST-130]|nr:hypothetical protein KEM48_001191 [Puccinia striiformis f. sp. tritici PST-130]